MECKKCGGTKHSKNGFVKGHQKYKCKECGYQFTPELHKGYDEQTKLIACLLYINGLSFRTIGRLLNVSTTSVFYWVKKFALKHYEKLKPISKQVVVELDEMWHFLHVKKTSYGYGKPIVVLQDNLLSGNVAIDLYIK